MKVKGLISAFLALAILAGLGVAASADSAYINNTNDTGFVVIADNDMRAKTVVADYDVNGRLVSVFTKAVDLKKHDNTFTYDELGVSGISANRKTMLWNEEGIEPADKTRTAVDMTTDISNYTVAYVEAADITDGLGTIWFGTSSTTDSKLKLLEGRKYSFTLNGKAISADEIKTGDVIAIKCDADMSIGDLDSCEVTVSRSAVDGVIVSCDYDAAMYTLDNGVSYADAGIYYGDLELGTNYRLYLDVFGRIAYAEEIVDYGNIGVIRDVYTTDTGYKVKISKSVGGSDRYVISEEVYNELYNMVYIDDNEKYGLYRRVISYDITDSGEFELNERLKGVGGEVVTYTPDAGLFDNVKVIMDDPNDDITTIIYEEDLIEGKKYKVWYFGKNAGNTYELAVVQAVQEIENTTPMAIYVSRTTEDTLEGTYDVINAYVDGELKELFVDTEFDFETGDVFFFLKDADGFVTTIEPIFKESVPKTYTELYNKVLDNNFDILDAEVVEAFENSGKDCTLVFGAIMGDDGGYCVDLATKDTVTDLEYVDIYNHTTEYDISDNVRVYKYDYLYTNVKNRVEASSKTMLRANRFPRGSEADDGGDAINLRSEELLDESNPDCGIVRFALLKIVDDEVLEALVFEPSSDA